MYLVEKPYQVFVPLPVGVSEERAINLVFDLGDEEMMRGIRGSSASFTLDEHGFTICLMDILFHFFSDMGVINYYIPETCDLVKEAVNAELVVPFDWRVCHACVRGFLFYNNTWTDPQERQSHQESMIPLLPAVHIHIVSSLIPLGT